jgi:hypothetical protein
VGSGERIEKKEKTKTSKECNKVRFLLSPPRKKWKKAWRVGGIDGTWQARLLSSALRNGN